MKALDFKRVPGVIRGRRLRIFLDFDGTLSDHRLDGEKSRLLPAAREALAELARLPNVRTFVVTGRAIGDVRRRIGVRGVCYAGNHGLRISGPGQDFEHPFSQAARRAIGGAAGLLRERIGGRNGARICQNGLSLSLNVGLMPAGGRRAAAAIVSSSAPELRRMRLRWQEGHLGWDLIPEVGWNKGDAVRRLLGRETAVLPIAIGDGRSDEPMFEQAGERGGISIRVGFSASSSANYWVQGPRDVARLLRTIAREQNDIEPSRSSGKHQSLTAPR